jgi:hypothetical protein
MMKFYIVKRDEREGDGYKRIVEFENHHDLEDYLRYNRAYIEEMKSLDEDTTYSFEDVQGNKVEG